MKQSNKHNYCRSKRLNFCRPASSFTYFKWFHASHKNLAGTGAAINVTSIGAGRAAMMKQKGLDGKTRIRPIARYLLVPAALETEALQLVAQNLVPRALLRPFQGRERGLRVLDGHLELRVLLHFLAAPCSADLEQRLADPGRVEVQTFPALEQVRLDAVAIEVNDEARRRMIESLRRYLSEEMEEEIGELKASLLLDFVLKEIAPTVHNQAVADAQSVLQDRVGELEETLYRPEFGYWKR